MSADAVQSAHLLYPAPLSSFINPPSKDGGIAGRSKAAMTEDGGGVEEEVDAIVGKMGTLALSLSLYAQGDLRVKVGQQDALSKG